MSDTQKVMELIKEHEVKFVDFRFTDPRGEAYPVVPGSSTFSLALEARHT
jgi:glutamine synthetase